jgi:hypothetical protein
MITVRLLLIWCALLTVALVWQLAGSLSPVVHDVRPTDVTFDIVSGQCYRVRWLDATDRFPGGPISTDGVLCPYGVGNNREPRTTP